MSATLSFYEDQTTTPKSVYTDNTLSTPLPWPVQSDDAGNFPTIWADTGTDVSPNLYLVAWAAEDGQARSFSGIRSSVYVTQGEPGVAATVAVGTTSTVPYGGVSAVTNVGTSNAAILNFQLVEGPEGPTGDGSGNVLGPASSIDGHVAVFDGPTGTRLKDGGSVQVGDANWTGVPLSIVHGGTGSSTATDARTALGLGSAATVDYGNGPLQVPRLDLESKFNPINGINLFKTGSWKIVSQFVPIAGPATADFFPISLAKYSELALVFVDTSGSATGTLQMKISNNNGTTLSAAINISASLSAASTANGMVWFTNVEADQGMCVPAVGATTGAIAATPTTLLPIALKHTGGLTGLQVLYSSGVFDGGQILLMGRL